MIDLEPLHIDCCCGQALTVRVVLTRITDWYGNTRFTAVTDHDWLATHLASHDTEEVR